MKNLYSLTLIFFLFSCITATAQSPHFVWGKSTGSNVSNPSKMTMDAGGNFFIAGSYSSDSATFGNVTLRAANPMYFNSYIVRLDPDGNVLWAQGSRGRLTFINGLKCDKKGNVYITGTFQGDSLTFGGITVSPTAGTAGIYNYFFAKCDSNGNFLWIKVSGGGYATLHQGNGLAIDQNDHIFVSGGYEAYMTDTLEIGNFTLTAQHKDGSFVAKYDTSGNAIWVKTAIGSYTGNFSGDIVSTDAGGNVFIARTSFSDTLYFDAVMLLNPTSYARTYIAKYDNSGTLQWVKNSTGPTNTYVSSISTDDSGNAVITGSTLGGQLLIWGSDTIARVDSAPGYSQMYVSKFDPGGNVLWAKTANGNSSGTGLCADHSGHIYSTGYFFSDSLTIGTFTFTNADTTTSDFFVTEYDAAGNLLMAKKATGANSYGENMLADDSNHVFIYGGFAADSILFDTLLLYGPATTSSVFIAELSSMSLPTGIVSIAHETALKLYPNPAGQTLNIHAAASDVQSYEIYDAIGNMITTQKVCTQTFSIGLSTLSTGLYLIKVNSSTGQSAGKFIKE